MALLEVKGIKKSFGRTKVLKGIDFDLQKGEVLSIIGSSGSGKTTLLRDMAKEISDGYNNEYKRIKDISEKATNDINEALEYKTAKYVFLDFDFK